MDPHIVKVEFVQVQVHPITVNGFDSLLKKKQNKSHLKRNNSFIYAWYKSHVTCHMVNLK